MRRGWGSEGGVAGGRVEGGGRFERGDGEWAGGGVGEGGGGVKAGKRGGRVEGGGEGLSVARVEIAMWSEGVGGVRGGVADAETAVQTTGNVGCYAF